MQGFYGRLGRGDGTRESAILFLVCLQDYNRHNNRKLKLLYPLGDFHIVKWTSVSVKGKEWQPITENLSEVETLAIAKHLLYLRHEQNLVCGICQVKIKEESSE